MSGGSFNYLSSKDPADLLGNSFEELEYMASWLTEQGFTDVAGETEDILAEVKTISAEVKAFERRVGTRMKRLERVWGAVEWCVSGDISMDDVHKAIEEYRGRV